MYANGNNNKTPKNKDSIGFVLNSESTIDNINTITNNPCNPIRIWNKPWYFKIPALLLAYSFLDSLKSLESKLILLPQEWQKFAFDTFLLPQKEQRILSFLDLLFSSFTSMISTSGVISCVCSFSKDFAW